MKISFWLVFLLISNVFAQKPHPVPELKDLYKPWIFARASEASTLFIEPHFKGAEPYAHLINSKKKLQWFEYDGVKGTIWNITHYTKTNKDLTLYIENGDRVVITPYWDIDHCLLIIRFTSDEEINPTRFAVPYKNLTSIPYQKPEG